MIIGGIVLAAGLGRRYGGDKMLHPITVNQSTLPMGVVSARNLTPHVNTLVCVVRPEDFQLQHALDAQGIKWVANADYQSGMSSSIKAGVNALSDCDYVLIALGDMPFIRHSTYANIHTLVCQNGMLGGTAPIIQPVFKQTSGALKPGHPVAFPSSYFNALSRLTGDTGAKSILQEAANNNRLTHYDCSDEGILIDIDQPD